MKNGRSTVLQVPAGIRWGREDTTIWKTWHMRSRRGCFFIYRSRNMGRGRRCIRKFKEQAWAGLQLYYRAFISYFFLTIH